MEKGKIENKLATSVEIKATDCPQRYAHRQLVGTGESCGFCGVVIPAGPFQTTEWAAYGITTLIDRPSPPTPKGEQDARDEHDREMELCKGLLREAGQIRGTEIAKLHELTGYTRNGDAVQANFSSRTEQALLEKARDLEASAAAHERKARAALARGADLAASRNDAFRRSLVTDR